MLKILWKRGEIAPQEQYLLLSTIFCYLMLDFCVKTRLRFSFREMRLFEITEVEITRVDCTSHPILVWGYQRFVCMPFYKFIKNQTRNTAFPKAVILRNNGPIFSYNDGNISTCLMKLYKTVTSKNFSLKYASC